MQVCGHLCLCDPTLDLASPSEPVTASIEGAAAEVLEAKVKDMVEAFLQVVAAAAEEAENDDDTLGDA